MVYVDVFSKPSKKGKIECYLAPVYPHQVMDKRGWPRPPLKAVVGGKDESGWVEIGPDHEFRFSLYPCGWVKVVKSDGTAHIGYFIGLDRSTGAINLAMPHDPRRIIRSIGARTLLTLKKYNVDRFGARAEVKSEVRT